MTTDKLDAEHWAKRYEKIFDEVHEAHLKNIRWTTLDTGKETMRRFFSELPQLTAGTMGAEELARLWLNAEAIELGGNANWETAPHPTKELYLDVAKAVLASLPVATVSEEEIMHRKTIGELKLRLQQLFDLPMYENGEGWITSFTKDQFHGSVKRCMEILDDMAVAAIRKDAEHTNG